MRRGLAGVRTVNGAARLVENSGGIGATIAGIDLSAPLDDADGARLREWLARYHVLAFRGQHLDPAAQIRVMRAFGKVIDEARDGLFYSAVTADAGSLVKPGRLMFHLDNHFTPEPLEVLSLYGEQVDPGGAPTLFVDNVQAMARLPDELVRRIEDVEALNVSYYFWGQGGDRAARSVEPDIPEAPRTWHPLIARHPVTDEPLLFLTELHTRCLRGMPIEESDALLGELREYLYAGNQYEHEWRTGDLVIWDNRAMQHARGPTPPDSQGRPVARSLRRVVVGDKSFDDQFTLPAEIMAAR